MWHFIAGSPSGAGDAELAGADGASAPTSSAALDVEPDGRPNHEGRHGESGGGWMSLTAGGAGEGVRAGRRAVWSAAGLEELMSAWRASWPASPTS